MKLLILLVSFSHLSFANSTPRSTQGLSEKKRILEEKEVLENPTLKTLSGSLKSLSLYSSFSYRGGSLKDPLSAERPNILSAEETAGLVEMSGNIGGKYRLTEDDNISLQVGVYSIAPFHSRLETDNQLNRIEFDENAQDVDADDPTLSYFKTYYLGAFQNITFIKYQYVTRGIYRDRGFRSAFALSQASAYKINPYAYIAGTITYENLHYDKSQATYLGREFNLLPFQTRHRLRGNLSTEVYAKRNIAFRFITDVFSYYQLRGQAEVLDRSLQQTLAMSYFFNRDISISPNVRFLLSDIRMDRTNVTLNVNVNL